MWHVRGQRAESGVGPSGRLRSQRGDLGSVVVPCLVLGVCAVLVGAVTFLAYRGESDMGHLSATLGRLILVGGAIWCIPQVVGLWWIQTGRRLAAWLFLVAVPVALGGIPLAVHTTIQHPVPALVVMLVLGPVLCREWLLLVSLLRRTGTRGEHNFLRSQR